MFDKALIVDALAIQCPHCGAEPNEPCRDPLRDQWAATVGVDPTLMPHIHGPRWRATQSYTAWIRQN